MKQTSARRCGRSTRCRPARDACDRECCGWKTARRIPNGPS